MKKYGGYSNKSTWTLTIWLETDESLKNYWRYKTKSLPKDELSKELQTYFKIETLSQRSLLSIVTC